MSGETLLPDLVRAAGGQIVGRVRLQKLVYLLDQLGLKSGFRFTYHHYGPYSEELSEAIANATVLHKSIREDQKTRASDGASYSVFLIGERAPDPTVRVGGLAFEEAKHALDKMQSRPATVLELAATIHWLQIVESVADWRTELKVRKGLKAMGGRAKQAEDLLREVDLLPAQ
jgi:uncharacterized protein